MLASISGPEDAAMDKAGEVPPLRLHWAEFTASEFVIWCNVFPSAQQVLLGH